VHEIDVSYPYEISPDLCCMQLSMLFCFVEALLRGDDGMGYVDG